MLFYSPVATCPPEIRKVADGFKDLTGSGYCSLVTFLCGAIMGVKSLSAMARFFLFSPSVSTLSRFLQMEGLNKKLNRRHRRRLLRLLDKQKNHPGRYIWVIDDTLIPGFGKKIWGSYRWFDHTSSSTVQGHKLLMLGLVDRYRKVLIPVFWEILHREDKDSPQNHKKGWEVAIDLLDQAVNFGFPILPVVADSWFANEEIFAALNKRKFPFVMEIKSNRRVVQHGLKSLNVSVTEFFQSRLRKKIFYWSKVKWAAEATLWFRGARDRLKTVAVANKKGLVHECFAYYVSNRLAWDASKVWGLARDRWTIEVQFRELKQLFTLGGTAVRSKESVETAISVAVIALTVIRLEQLNRVDANENQYVRPKPAGSIVSEYQVSSMQRSILTLVTKPSIQEKLRLRLCKENFGRKPTEKIKMAKTSSETEKLRTSA